MGKQANSNTPVATGDAAADSPNTENPNAEVETPPAGGGDAANDGKPAEKSEKSEKSYTQTDLDRAVARAIKDAQKKAADAEAKAKLTEDERAQAEMTDLKNQIRERDARDTVKDAVAKLGVKNPAAIYRIVAGDLEFDDKGNVSNLDDVLESAKTDFPELFDTKPNESIDAGAGTTKTGDVLTKEKLAKMTPAEINELPWEDVQKVLAAK